MRILVTGGAGYIGGTFVRAALSAGHEVVVLDNLSTGQLSAVPEGAEFVQADIRERSRLETALSRCDAVVHFAALSIISDSVTDPVGYYRENLGSFLALLDGIKVCGPRRLIFSSSAAVYGHGSGKLFLEDDPCSPVNPYGGTKLAMEQTLAHVAGALDLKWFALRYFNAAGAVPGHGESHDPETHLIPLALEAALGQRELKIFGRDYDTADGTCIRDYIHVRDLARAHLAALAALDMEPRETGSGGPQNSNGGIVNLGTGLGQSVLEVLASVERVTGRSLNAESVPRREGDPPLLVAGVERAAEVLGWEAETVSLDEIVASAWEWARR
jgi:UDP-glucose 4-epimerase